MCLMWCNLAVLPVDPGHCLVGVVVGAGLIHHLLLGNRRSRILQQAEKRPFDDDGYTGVTIASHYLPFFVFVFISSLSFCFPPPSLSFLLYSTLLYSHHFKATSSPGGGHFTGSYPFPPNGLHLINLQAVSTVPFPSPCFL